MEAKFILHSGRDVSSTSKNLKITQKPRILLKAKVFYAPLLYYVALLHRLSSFIKHPFYFSPTSIFKGFLTSKACLTPFSHKARVSDFPMGALSARENKRLAEQADDAPNVQMLDRFSSRFSQLAKRAECLA